MRLIDKIRVAEIIKMHVMRKVDLILRHRRIKISSHWDECSCPSLMYVQRTNV